MKGRRNYPKTHLPRSASKNPIKKQKYVKAEVAEYIEHPKRIFKN